MNSQQNILKYAVCLMALVLIMFGCKTSSQTKATKEAIKSSYSGIQKVKFQAFLARGVKAIETEQDLFIQTQEEWDKLKTGDPSEGTQIDFDTHMVVGCHMGMKEHGGFKAKIMKVEQKSDTLIVTRNFFTPGPSCIITMTISYPHQWVKIPKMKISEVRFDGELITRDCY
ncbi:MAG: protease complex subunit PrcB family protein [Bacteroidota bacterium]